MTNKLIIAFLLVMGWSVHSASARLDLPGDNVEIYHSFLCYDTSVGNQNSLHMGVDITADGEDLYSSYSSGAFKFVLLIDSNGEGMTCVYLVPSHTEGEDEYGKWEIFAHVTKPSYYVWGEFYSTQNPDTGYMRKIGQISGHLHHETYDGLDVALPPMPHEEGVDFSSWKDPCDGIHSGNLIDIDKPRLLYTNSLNQIQWAAPSNISITAYVPCSDKSSGQGYLNAPHKVALYLTNGDHTAIGSGETIMGDGDAALNLQNEFSSDHLYASSAPTIPGPDGELFYYVKVVVEGNFSEVPSDPSEAKAYMDDWFHIAWEIFDDAGLDDHDVEIGDELGASPVTNFFVNGSSAYWSVVGLDQTIKSFKIVYSPGEDFGPGEEVGNIKFSGSGTYETSIRVSDAVGIYKLIGVSPIGGEVCYSFQRIAEEKPMCLPPSFINLDQSRKDLEKKLLALDGLISEEKRQNIKSLDTQCVIYCASQFVTDVENYLISFWGNYMEVGVELVDIGQYPTQSETFRSTLKASIAAKAGSGVELFHFIGDANEWEEGGYGENEADRDLIPTYYLYDSPKIPYDRPYYSTDFPYSDINEDGLPDVVVTRWPVATIEELLPRISKVIDYNTGRSPDNDLNGVNVLALIGDVDYSNNSGLLAEETALHCLDQIPSDSQVSVTIGRASEAQIEGDQSPEAYQLWNEVQPECIFMWSPHSSSIAPNNILRQPPELEESYPSLVLAANCMTADFSRERNSTRPFAADVFSQYYDRGSIAWIGPTAGSYQRVNKEFSAAFIRNLFANPNWSMAKVWVESIREAILLSEGDPTKIKNIKTYSFLGDPLSRLEKKQESSTLVDITPSPISNFDHCAFNSADWADVDGDGYDDLYITRGSSGSIHELDFFDKLLINESNGNFSNFNQVPEGDGINWDGSSKSATWGDVDNDGDPDLFVSGGGVSTGGPSTSVLIINDSFEGSLGFSAYQGSGYMDLNDLEAGGRSEWIDIDGDGDLDLYHGRIGHTANVFENLLDSGSLGFLKKTVPLLSDIVGDGYSAWGDYDNDGDVDVFVFSDLAGNGNHLLRNDGNWLFSDRTNSVGSDFIAESVGHGKAAAWGDYDNDGDFDLVIAFQNYCRLFQNDAGIFSEVSEDMNLPSFGLLYNSIAWSDVDLDCDLDLVLGFSMGVEVWENKFPFNGFEVLDDYGFSTIGQVMTVSLSDVDLDGDDDFYLGTYNQLGWSSGSCKLYENNINHETNWIKVNLDGELANRDGIGSLIKVFTGIDHEQTRQLVGAFGGNSHASHTQTFGLGGNQFAKKVRVEWPWGRVTEVPIVQSGQIITISDENAASQIGEIYLTTDPSGSRQGFENPIPQYGTFDLYLVADISDGLSNGYQLGGFEIGVSFPEMIHLSSEQLLIEGVNDGDGMIAHSEGTRYDFSVKFTTGTTGDNGIVPLASFSCNISQEGPNPEISLVTGRNNSFQDPIEPSVPCWWESESDVLFRFADAAQSGGIEVPVFDNKAPVCAHAGLWMDYRSFLIVSFDEPINNVCTNGLSSTDVSNFEVYNISNPASFKTIVSIVPFAGDQDFLVILDSDIQEQREYNIKIENFQDWHSNPAGTVIEPVTRNDSGGDDPGINEVLTGGGFAKDGSGAEVIWVELLNNSDSSVCLNGWSLATSDSMQVTIPDTQVLILRVGEFAVLAGPGQMPEGLDQNIVKFEFETPLELDSGSIAVLDPFGEVVDLVDANVLLKSTSFKSVSAQKFEDNNGNAVTWEFDGPEYVPGMTGTPGQENRRSDGSSNNPDVPTMSGLLYAAPNPFNPMTSIYLSILDRGHYSVDVFDIRGRKVKTLFSGVVEPTAKMEVIWNGDNKNGGRVASGTYFVRLRSDSSVHNTLKVTILK